MSNSTRYFQLTPDILLEYNYTTTSIITEEEQKGDVSDREIDLQMTEENEETLTVINNNNDSNTYLYLNDKITGRDNFVMPLNKSYTKFVLYNRKSINGDYDKYQNDTLVHNPYGDNSENGEISIQQDCDIVVDKIRLHFTSRNFFGEFEGLILQAYIYDNLKNKIDLLSFRINRFQNLILNAEPLLINQKLYTTYIDFNIISTECMLYFGDKNNYKKDNYMDSYGTLLHYILGDDRKLMKNTPIMFNIIGIKNSFESKSAFSHEFYNCEVINEIIVPSKDSYNEVFVDISEAEDGDYFKIKAKAKGYGNFAEFIKTLSETPESYIILHELFLTEHYVDSNNHLNQEVTHREHYMINAAIDENNEMKINSGALNEDFLYRPICKYGGRDVCFVITDVLKIVDTLSNTTIVKKSSLRYNKPYKYGKHLNKIYLGEVPSQINVYNKRSNIMDEDIDKVVISSSHSGDGINIQTNEIGIVAFCETSNIRITTADVSIINKV